jgi:hypothetical protein
MNLERVKKNKPLPDIDGLSHCGMTFRLGQRQLFVNHSCFMNQNSNFWSRVDQVLSWSSITRKPTTQKVHILVKTTQRKLKMKLALYSSHLHG